MSYTFKQTSPCGRGERHINGMVGKFWRIQDPDSVRFGSGVFLKGRLKKGDLFYCAEHSGDCFQTYHYVQEYDNRLVVTSKWSFSSYGIGDAVEVDCFGVDVRHE